jgi:hypothetical protein
VNRMQKDIERRRVQREAYIQIAEIREKQQISEMFVPTTSQNSRRGPKSRSQSPLATPEDLKNLLKESQNKIFPVQSRKNLNREAVASRKD